MSCHCRAASWRTFVQGLAQVHKLEASAASPILPLRLRPALYPSTLRTRSQDAISQSRSFSASNVQRQEAVAAAPSPEREVVQEPEPSSPQAADPAPSTATEPEGTPTGVAKPKSPRKPKAPKDGSAVKTKKPRKPKAPEDDSVESTTKTKTRPKTKPRAKADGSEGESSESITKREAKPKAERKIKLKAPDEDSAEPRTKPKKKPRVGREEKAVNATDSGSTASESSTPKSTAQDSWARLAEVVENQGATAVKPDSRPIWAIQKEALKKKFPEGWKPLKRLSPDALAGIRALNAQFPDTYTTSALADRFQVPAEAIRRILKSKWQPSVNEEEDRQQRWFRRGMSVWNKKAELGMKPPKKWRREGIVRDPSYHEWSRKASEREQKWEEEENKKYRMALDERRSKKDV